MPSPILYLLKLSVSLSIVWLFYQCVLRRLTFYNSNRWYLVAYSLAAFLIPMIRLEPVKEGASTGVLLLSLPQFAEGPAEKGITADTIWQIVSIALVLGSFVFFVKLLLQWVSVLRIRRSSKLLKHDKIRIYQVDAPIIPFSFGNSVYINQKMHSEREFEEIILHEYVHVRQKHTVDIILGELLVIVNWYNPFAWLLRFSIRQNLEFVADQQVLDNGFDKKDYQYHLLKVIGQSQYRLANNFNFSSLKKRIVMMNKSKSARLNLLRFVFITPLLAILLLAFRDRIHLQQATRESVGAAAQADTMRPAAMSIPVILSDDPSAAKPAGNGSYSKPKLQMDDSSAPREQMEMDADSITFTNPGRKSLAPGEHPDTFSISSVVRNGHGSVKMRILPGRDTVPAVPASAPSPAAAAAPAAPVPAAPVPAAPLPVIVEDHPGRIEQATSLVGLSSSNVLYVVDGIVVTKSIVGALDPRLIASVNVLKGDKGVKVYGNKGRNGVIQITTKPRPDFNDNAPRIVPDTPRIVMGYRTITDPKMAQPLFVIDGKEVMESVFKQLDPSTIKSVEVVKDASGTSAYGDKGRNGVILITLKKP